MTNEDEEKSPNGSLKRQSTFTIGPEESETESESAKMDRKSLKPTDRKAKVPKRTPKSSNKDATFIKPKTTQKLAPEPRKMGGSNRVTNYDADDDEDSERQDRDESLGILTPSAMKSGLPSLSASCVSDFGFDPLPVDPLPVEEEISGSNILNSSANRSFSTPKTKSKPSNAKNVLNSKVSISPIKTFSLDSQKMKEIEAITGSADKEILNVTKVIEQTSPKKRLNVTSNLVRKTDNLLKSNQKRFNRKSLDETMVIEKLNVLNQNLDKTFTTQNNNLDATFNKDIRQELNVTKPVIKEDPKLDATFSCEQECQKPNLLTPHPGPMGDKPECQKMPLITPDPGMASDSNPPR